MNVNCDMGEGYGPWEKGDDAAIMPLIDWANIACGAHAGDPDTMAHVSLAGFQDAGLCVGLGHGRAYLNWLTGSTGFELVQILVDFR